ncbi:MAG: carbon starvation CstA family protein [Dialister invisus]
MNTLVLLLISIAVLFCGYVFGWVANSGSKRRKSSYARPHHEDGVDYVHKHPSSLVSFLIHCRCGPITGPIGAAMFGWLPVTLWVLIGGIFFGGVHDFGALFASIRHQGKSIGEIISLNMSKRAKQLFIIFSYLTLILVVAALPLSWLPRLARLIRTAFSTWLPARQKHLSPWFPSCLSSSLSFSVLPYTAATVVISSILGVRAIVLCMAVGMNFHPILFFHEYMDDPCRHLYHHRFGHPCLDPSPAP